MLDLDKELKKVKEFERRPDQKLGSTLIQPFTELNSGDRKILWSVHHQQKLNLLHGDSPYIATANENEMLRYSSNFVQAECDKQVIRYIEKFPSKPKFHYWLITVDLNGPTKGRLDLLERIDYVYLTESYGFSLDTKQLDRLRVNSIIRTGDIIKAPSNIDKYGNAQDGVNLLTVYLSNMVTQDDGYEISESAAKKLGSVLYHHVVLQLNDNDILLNLYGDNDTYKAMPEIGEDIKEGVFLAIRRQNNADSLFTQTWERLKTIIHPIDQKYVLDGTLVDIDLFSNNYDQLENGANSQYNNQIFRYLQNKHRYCKEIVEFVESYKKAYPSVVMTYKLQQLYDHAKSTILGYDHYKNGKKYSGTIVDFIIREHLPMRAGDKVTNRYGGKGVVAKINPDYMMPRFNGAPIEVIMNKATVFGRLNFGQLVEIEINYRSNLLLKWLREQYSMSSFEKLKTIRDYMSYFSANLAEYFWNNVNQLDDTEQEALLKIYFQESTIRMAIRPLIDKVNFDTLMAVDDAFKHIFDKRYYLETPIINSNGNLRYIKKSINPVIVGEEFFIRLKQYAKDKASVTSVSTVNSKSENSKSKNGKNHLSKFPDTPVRIGYMESEDMMHMDSTNPGITEISLMLYSSSSEIRDKFYTLYSSDPVHIHIELDKDSKSRAAEIFHTYFKQLGNELIFHKERVNKKEVYKDNCSWDIKLDEPTCPWHIKLDGDVEVKDKDKPYGNILISEDGSISTDINNKQAVPIVPINVTITKKGESNDQSKTSSSRSAKRSNV